MESWMNTLKKAIELDIEVDCYALEVVPGTMLARQIKEGKMPTPGNTEFETQMYLNAYKLLTDAGYKAVGHDRFTGMLIRIMPHRLAFCSSAHHWRRLLYGLLERFSYSNIEDINEYMAAVNAGRLPIARLAESPIEDMMRKVMTRLYLRLPVSKKEFIEMGHRALPPAGSFVVPVARCSKPSSRVTLLLTFPRGTSSIARFRRRHT